MMDRSFRAPSQLPPALQVVGLIDINWKSARSRDSYFAIGKDTTLERISGRYEKKVPNLSQHMDR